MTTVRTRLVLVLLGAAACKRGQIEDIDFDRRETLPGFAVSLPSGNRVKSDITPVAGQIIVERDGAVVTVGWQAGKIPKEDMPGIVTGIQAVAGTAVDVTAAESTDVAMPAPDYGTEFLLPTDKKIFMAMSVVQCMASNVTVTLATMAAQEPSRARAFHQRLVTTLECGEAAFALPTDGGLPKFAMDETIGYLPGSDPPAYFSLAGARWYVTPGVPAMRAAFERPEALAAMFGGLGVSITEQSVLSSAPEWLQVQAKVIAEGETGFMMAGVLTCGDAAYAVIHTRGDLAAPEAAELQRVQCPDGPADPSTLPTVSDRFGRACDSGDAHACEALAVLTEEEPKLLSGHDPARLRARACELGLAHTCVAQ